MNELGSMYVTLMKLKLNKNVIYYVNCLFPKIRLLLFSEVNNKSNQIHITTIMLPYEFMGKNLHYFNSALYSKSKSEVTTTFIRINWIEFQLVLADHLPIRGCSKKWLNFRRHFHTGSILKICPKLLSLTMDAVKLGN